MISLEINCQNDDQSIRQLPVDFDYHRGGWVEVFSIKRFTRPYI
jgi:hypothetical protein